MATIGAFPAHADGDDLRSVVSALDLDERSVGPTLLKNDAGLQDNWGHSGQTKVDATCRNLTPRTTRRRPGRTNLVSGDGERYPCRDRRRPQPGQVAAQGRQGRRPSSLADRRGGPVLDFSERGWQGAAQAKLRDETSRSHTRPRVTGPILVDLPEASAP